MTILGMLGPFQIILMLVPLALVALAIYLVLKNRS
jgi:hypothetical protein